MVFSCRGLPVDQFIIAKSYSLDMHVNHSLYPLKAFFNRAVIDGKSSYDYL